MKSGLQLRPRETVSTRDRPHLVSNGDRLTLVSNRDHSILVSNGDWYTLVSVRDQVDWSLIETKNLWSQLETGLFWSQVETGFSNSVSDFELLPKIWRPKQFGLCSVSKIKWRPNCFICIPNFFGLKWARLL